MNSKYDIHSTLQTQLVKRIRQLSAPMAPQPTGVTARLTPLSDIQAIVFDIYGTLFMSGTGDISIARAMSSKQALSCSLEFGGFSGDFARAGAAGMDYLLQAIRQSHDFRRKAGISSPEVDIRQEWERVLSQLQQEGLLGGVIDPEAIVRVSVEYECRVNPVWPMPDLAKTLNMLNERQLLLGIVSNAQFYTQLLFPAFLDSSYERMGFFQDLCVWSFELLEAKPSVNLFRMVVDRLRQEYTIPPEQVLYVGNDTLNDMWPATQLCLKTALFAGDQRSLRLREHDERCAALEPDLIITTLSQLVECL